MPTSASTQRMLKQTTQYPTVQVTYNSFQSHTSYSTVFMGVITGTSLNM